MTIFINLTDKAVCIVNTRRGRDEAGTMCVEFPPCGIVARVLYKQGRIVRAVDNPSLGFINIRSIETAKAEGIPDFDPSGDVFYIVAKDVLEAFPNRRDFVGTGHPLFNDDGSFLGYEDFVGTPAVFGFSTKESNNE